MASPTKQPQPETLKFNAEVKQVKSRKTPSLDIEYTITLNTLDPSVLALGALDAETMLMVEVRV